MFIMKNRIDSRMRANAWKRDWFSTICFTVFTAISIAMISLTAMLFTSLTGAIDSLMEEAKTPDFLQMHMGEIDIKEIESFAGSEPGVTDCQILGFLNLDNSILSIGGQTLLDSTQDNGLSTQGDSFDFMLDLNNRIPRVRPGQVYVPICYESVYQIKTGDIMKIGEEELTVAGFIRDSQMNSMMASSKRFLVCEADYERLRYLGREEYLIEFRFDDTVDSNLFKTAYEKAKLPMNGPTITGPLIKMMNVLSDGIMILIILLISLIVLIISLVCIRFMLITRIVSEADEVGVLRAIGITGKRIRNMFLTRYRVLILLGGIFGVLLSLILFNPLSAQMRRLYGVSQNKLVKFLFAVISAGIIAGAMILFVLRVLKKLNQMTALKALTGNYGENKKKGNRLCITLVTAFAVFLMVIPTNLYSTLSSPEFVTYMGIGSAEIRMDIREGAAGSEDFRRIEKMLSEDSEVDEYALFQTGSTPVMLSDKTVMNILLEYGNHTCFPVTYSQGSAPDEENEVALSYLLSEELELYPGDTILVKRSEEYEPCTISGVYSDITNGGKTAKIYEKNLSQTENVMWRIVYLTLKDGADKKRVEEKYSADGAEVVDIASRVKGTYGPTLLQVQRTSVIVDGVTFIIILFIIMLFIRMLISNLRYEISVKKAFGFKSTDIRKSFMKPCFIYAAAGIVFGTVLGCTLGENVCGVALKSLGAVGFEFVMDIPSIMINVILAGLAAVMAIFMGSKGINSIEAVECFRGKE